MTQVRVSKVSSNGRRWTNSEKSLAMSLYHTSRKAYDLMRTIFQLPAPTTLVTALQNLHVKPGLCTNIVNLLKVSVNKMRDIEKVCSVVFDEISLKAGLTYNPQDDLVEGFEDFGSLGRTRLTATHALVFMIRGISSKWKQPIAYYLTNGPCKHKFISIFLFEILNSILDIGLKPVVIICDQGTNNRALFKDLHISISKPFFEFRGDPVFCMYDPPHLIKSIRNNLKLYGFDINGASISWIHIVKFFEQDSSSPIRLAPKLTKRHLTVPPFSHLRVSLATQVLSHSVAAGMLTLSKYGCLPLEATHTANFLNRFNRLFNCFNSRTAKGSSEMDHAISNTSSHINFLNECIQWLDSVLPLNKTKKLPCLSGWKLSISALKGLWSFLRDVHEFPFLYTSRLNQDCLENYFSIIRQKGGHRFNPSSSEFRSAIRQTMVDSVMVTSKRKNCQDDADNFLFSLETIRSAGSNATVRTRLDTDIPLHIRSILQQDLPANLTITEDNVIVYLSGYIIKKLSKSLCQPCVTKLRGEKSTTVISQTFLHEKEYEGCSNGGIDVPSQLLTSAVTEMEKSFRSSVYCLHSTGIRCKLVSHMTSVARNCNLVCENVNCKVSFCVAALFVNIRLHFRVRCFNRDLAQPKKGQKRNRKAAEFSHQ